MAGRFHMIACMHGLSHFVEPCLHILSSRPMDASELLRSTRVDVGANNSVATKRAFLGESKANGGWPWGFRLSTYAWPSSDRPQMYSVIQPRAGFEHAHAPV